MAENKTIDVLVSEIEAETASSIRVDSESNPQDVRSEFARIVNKACADVSLRDKLLMMSEIENLAHVGVDLRGFDSFSDAEEMVAVAFAACVRQRTSELCRALELQSFSVGFLPAVEAVLEVAERAAVSKLMPRSRVDYVRESFENLSSSRGTLEDLLTALGGVYLFESLMASPKDELLHKRHGTDMTEMTRVKKGISRFRECVEGNQVAMELALSLMNHRLPPTPAARQPAP